MTRAEWVHHYISQAPNAPAFGTPEWEALPDGPAKVAAVVRAAECWRREGEWSAVTIRLTEEVDALRAAFKRGHDEGWRLWRSSARDHQSAAAIAADVEADYQAWIGGVA